jgi:hypothetical protein
MLGSPSNRKAIKDIGEGTTVMSEQGNVIRSTPIEGEA